MGQSVPGSAAGRAAGLSDAMREVCEVILHITQYGSTRSINAGAAAAIALYEWARQHAGT